MADRFVLDEIANPHPRMASRALELRTRYRVAPADPTISCTWHAYRECMADATGCSFDDLDAWLDRIEAERWTPRP